MFRESSVRLTELAILAVDDHSINREFLRSALKPLTARLALAANGREAIELCRHQPFDLVLMDLHMPDMDGLTTWQRICDQAGGDPPARVIALTADCREEERIRLLDAGFDGFLNKPVTLATLVETIERVLSGETGINQPIEDGSRSLLLDDARAIAAANHNTALVARLRQLLADDLEQRAPTLDAHLAAGRVEQATAILHQWAGACGYAGAARLERSCRALQRSLEHDLDSSPGTLCVHLLNLIECTRQAIRAGSAELSTG